jgi:hypothetical protein
LADRATQGEIPVRRAGLCATVVLNRMADLVRQINSADSRALSSRGVDFI